MFGVGVGGSYSIGGLLLQRLLRGARLLLVDVVRE